LEKKRMKDILILPDADAVAKEAAKLIAAEARAAVEARGRFVVAVSGGRTPWRMLRALAGEDVPWQAVHVVQVDERVAPAGHPDRNLTQRCLTLSTSASARTAIRPHSCPETRFSMSQIQMSR
jgi:6-phosphogluconolactonase